MAGPVVCLRLVRTADELGPVVLLAGEFEEWVRARILADCGIDFEFKSERDLFLDRAALEREVVAAWQPFTDDGTLILQVGITTASARK